MGNSPMAFNDYLAYLDGATADDAPLYLFDSAFARKAPQLAADYTVCPDAWQGPYLLWFCVLKGCPGSVSSSAFGDGKQMDLQRNSL